ncbi:MAG: hypothetical protein KKC77_03050 [Proteobacteria bacterium]|nr:hypothetical protein [Pseudomonadota bacterium]
MTILRHLRYPMVARNGQDRYLQVTTDQEGDLRFPKKPSKKVNRKTQPQYVLLHTVRRNDLRSPLSEERSPPTLTYDLPPPRFLRHDKIKKYSQIHSMLRCLISPFLNLERKF